MRTLLSKWENLRSNLLREKARSRCRKIPAKQVNDWLDQAAAGIWKAVEDHRRNGDSLSALEAQRAAETLLGVLDVLIDRAELREKTGN